MRKPSRQANHYSTLEMDCHHIKMAEAVETLQEDKAFINRMKTVPSYRWQNAEFQRLWRIANRVCK